MRQPDRLSGADLADFLRVEDQLLALEDDAESDTEVASGLAEGALKEHGDGASNHLLALLERFEAARDQERDTDLWVRVDRVAGVFADALNLVDEHDGCGWKKVDGRPSVSHFGLDFEAALTAADEPPRAAAKHMTGAPLSEREARSLGWTPPAPRKVASRLPERQRQVPRARERRGGSRRSSARSGDSGSSDDGPEPPPALAGVQAPEQVQSTGPASRGPA